MAQPITLNELDTAEMIYQYRDRLARYVLTLVHDPAEAEDLTQVALLRAYHNYASLRNPASLTSWLYRIATNVAFDHLRQRARRRSAASRGGS